MNEYLRLTKEETQNLSNNGCIEIVRDGINILVEYDNFIENYVITLISPYKGIIFNN